MAKNKEDFTPVYLRLLYKESGNVYAQRYITTKKDYDELILDWAETIRRYHSDNPKNYLQVFEYKISEPKELKLKLGVTVT